MEPNLSRNEGQSTRPKKDWLLLLLLLVFNIWSGATTVIGTRQILPDGLALVSGVSVQTMLFCLLSGSVMRHSVVRKSIAILTFSLVSIYTSFFCYYTVMTADAVQQYEQTRAIQAHQSFIAGVYTPLKEEVRSLRIEIDNLDRLSAQECSSSQDCAEKKELRRQADRKTPEYQRLQEILDEVSEKANFDNRGLIPTEIYSRDLELLSSIPTDVRGGYELRVDDYISNEVDVEILSPFSKVFVQRESAAIFAILIAAGVDGILILQGSAINISQRRRNNLPFLPTQPTGTPQSLVEFYLEKIKEQSRLSSIVLAMSVGIYLLVCAVIDSPIQAEIVIFPLMLIAVIQARLVLIAYRIRSGFYGTNYYEAKEIISFMHDPDNNGGTPPKGGRKAFPIAIKSKQKEIDKKLGGEVVTWG